VLNFVSFRFVNGFNQDFLVFVEVTLGFKVKLMVSGKLESFITNVYRSS